jgi:hypothetical protein
MFSILWQKRHTKFGLLPKLKKMIEIQPKLAGDFTYWFERSSYFQSHMRPTLFSDAILPTTWVEISTHGDIFVSMATLFGCEQISRGPYAWVMLVAAICQRKDCGATTSNAERKQFEGALRMDSQHQWGF